MQVAESKGLPKLKYHLLPRTKGFTTTLQCLNGTGGKQKQNLPYSKCMFCLVFQSHFLYLSTVKAVYDVTLNFKDNQTPTLLGIVNGKKYRADMSVRWVQLIAIHSAIHLLWTQQLCNNDAWHRQLCWDCSNGKWWMHFELCGFLRILFCPISIKESVRLAGLSASLITPVQ